MSGTNGETHPPRINCVLVCGGVWHDMDFARLELLKLLAEDQRVRTRVFEDYENTAAIASITSCPFRATISRWRKWPTNSRPRTRSTPRSPARSTAAT